jgi:RNA polymerase sigma-70 factor (ECF subfamily)
MRLIKNFHDAEDILITSFIRIFNHIGDFEYRGETSLIKWMKTIVINESIRFINQRKKITFEDTDQLEIPNEHINDINNIDTEIIYALIEQLPDGYRMVFNLYAIEGYTHKEIGELLNISENTSKSQLHKARKQIIENIKKTENYGIA